MKKWLCALLCALLLLLPLLSVADGKVINLIENPDAAYTLDETNLLEIDFPAIHGSDCCIFQHNGQVMMLDCSTDDQAPTIVAGALQKLGITHVDVAVNSHPHDDHLAGFAYLPEDIKIDTLYIGFPQNYNGTMKKTLHQFAEQGRVGEIGTIANGDTLTFADDVTFFAMQHSGPEYTTNDKSVVLNLHFGDASMIFLGDVEDRGQRALVGHQTPEELKADIMKYPHHGHSSMRDELLAEIDPELAIVTAHELPARHAFDYLARHHLPALSTWYGMIRLRTDGKIWVIDRITTGENTGETAL